MADETTGTAGPSRRSVLGLAVGAGAAALAAGVVLPPEGTAHAQVGGPPIAMRGSITLAGAHKALEAADAKARELGVPMTIVVVDESGYLKAAARQDGNAFGSIEIVMRKAYTAAAFRAATGPLGQGVYGGDPARAASFSNLTNIWLGGGGVPLTMDGQVIGAIGAGGGTPAQDTEVAQAGADALGK